MKRLLLWVMGLSALVGIGLHAQAVKPDVKDVTGTWQMTLPLGGQQLRLVMKLSRDDGALKAVLYSIDQAAQPISANAVSLQGSTLKVGVVAIGGSFEGKVSADWNSIDGTWGLGPTPIPSVWKRATVASTTNVVA